MLDQLDDLAHAECLDRGSKEVSSKCRWIHATFLHSCQDNRLLGKNVLAALSKVRTEEEHVVEHHTVEGEIIRQSIGWDTSALSSNRNLSQQAAEFIFLLGYVYELYCVMDSQVTRRIREFAETLNESDDVRQLQQMKQLRLYTEALVDACQLSRLRTSLTGRFDWMIKLFKY